MKFVDEATVRVQAGNGGRGSASFRREKSVPFGGPDGGDGGHGGSVWLRAMEGINTLADFRIERVFKAHSGDGGSANGCTGRSGEDLFVLVPVGTVVRDADSEEPLGDLASAGRQGRLGQHPLQIQHQPRAATVRSGTAGRETHAGAGTESDCRRRPARA